MSVFKSVAHWVVDALPDISNLILVLVGVIMSLPKLAEKVEDHAKARYFLAIGCIVLGLAGFVVSVNQRRAATSQSTALAGNVNTLVAETNILITNTNNLVSSMGGVVLLGSQVSAINSHITELDTKIGAAKGNPKLVAELKSQRDAAQKIADNSTKEFFSFFVPQTIQELVEIEQWHHRTRFTMISNFYGVHPTKNHSAEQIMSENKAELNQLDNDYRARLKPALSTANALRERMLQELVPSEEDKTEAAIFTAAVNGDPVNLDLQQTTSYLDTLLKRVQAK